MTKRLGIIAGKGLLPLDVAFAARIDGYEVFIFPIIGQSDAIFDGFTVVPIRLGAIANARAAMLESGIRQLVMVGKVGWPSLAALRPDFDGVKLLGRMITKGDDGALRLIKSYFMEKGIDILGVDLFLRDRKMPIGVISGPAPTAEESAIIAQAVSVLSALGSHDVGQSIVAQNGRILAIEAAEGTDAMLTRCHGLIHASDGIACFVKMAKSHQERNLDTPVIGCKTIEVAANAGIGLVAAEAGKVLLADDLERLGATCEQLNVRMCGIETSN